MKRNTSFALSLLLAALCAALVFGCTQVTRGQPEEAIVGSPRGAYPLGSSSPEGALILHQEDSIQGVPVTHFIAIELEPDTVVRYQDGSERRWDDLDIGGEGFEGRPVFMESEQANTRVVFGREPTGFHARRIEYVDPSTEPSAAASWLDREWIEAFPGGVFRTEALLLGGSDPPGPELSFGPDGTAEWVPASDDHYDLRFKTLMSMENGAWVWHGLEMRASQTLLSKLLSVDLSDGSVDLFDVTFDQLLQVDFSMNAGELELVDLEVLGGFDEDRYPGLLPQ